MRRPLLLLCACSLLWVPAEAGPSGVTGHYLSFHRPPKMRVLNSHELRFWQQLKAWYRKHKLKPPRLDLGLREAAWQLARKLAQKKRKSLPNSWVQKAMWLGGRTDHRIRIFARGYNGPKDLWKALRRALARSLAGQRLNFHGFALYGRTQKICVLLFVRRGALLKPLPRVGLLGQTLRIQGKLLPRFTKPWLIVGLPNGGTQRIQIKPRKRDRSFLVQWYVKNTGNIRIQLTVQDDEGPWISAQWRFVVVAKAPQMSPTLRKLWRSNTRTPKARKTIWMSGKHKNAKAWTPRAAEARLLQLVNQARKKRGLATVRLHPRLIQIARSHSNDMVKDHFFAHTSPQKGSFAERFARLRWKVKVARENIAVGRSPKAALKLLLRSPGHRANLLYPHHKLTGVGVAKDAKGKLYFTQVFVVP